MNTNTIDTPDRVITPKRYKPLTEVSKDNEEEIKPKEPDKWNVVLSADRIPCEWVHKVIKTVFGSQTILLLFLVEWLMPYGAKIVLVKGTTKDIAESKANQAMDMLSSPPGWTCKSCVKAHTFYACKVGEE